MYNLFKKRFGINEYLSDCLTFLAMVIKIQLYNIERATGQSAYKVTSSRAFTTLLTDLSTIIWLYL